MNDSREILPIKSSLVGEEIASSNKTKVSELGDRMVLKSDLRALSLEKEAGESDEQYQARRLKYSMEIIRTEIDNERQAKSSLTSDKIYSPLEYHFIGVGEDGYSCPFRVQNRANGVTLREVSEGDYLNILPDIETVIKASVASFARYGKM